MKRLYLLLLIAVICIASFPIRAAQNTITLTVALPDYVDNSIKTKILADYEAAHPGIHVALVDWPEYAPQSEPRTERELKDAESLARTADVLAMDTPQFSEAITHTGFFLDLKPLIDQDKALNVDDYYPVVWQSAGWDGAIWMIPSSFDLSALIYDPAEFDKAGLAYPTDQWTWDDLAQAARALTQKAADGSVTRHGINIYDRPNLLRSLAGVDLFDQSAIPNMPAFNQPQLEKVLNDWSTLEREGAITRDRDPNPPMVVASLGYLTLHADRKLALALLPGGHAGIFVQGYTISGGTQYPQQAYELARYLADIPALTASDSIPARQNAGNDAIRQLPATMQTILPRAIENAIPVSRMRYIDDALDALDQMRDGISMLMKRSR
jgi:maltose-binding protein MalE